MDITRVSPVKVIDDAIEGEELHFDVRAYAKKVVMGYHEASIRINGMLAERIPDYDFNRIAAIDRNVLRIAAYELFYEPAIPPAVTINEAIEIAKKYSTAESGKFVNGVLGKLLSDSPKANWDPASAPPEEIEEPSTEPEYEIEVVEEFVEAGSEEEKSIARIAGWKIKSETE